MLSYAQWADALSDSLAELFASFEHGELEAEVTIFMTDASQQLYGYSRGLCSVLAGAGFEVTILTGAHQFVAQKLGSYLGVDEERIVGCRQNQDANGHYLNSYTPGFTSMPAEKLPWAATSGYERHKSIALGDSSSDLELLAAMDKRVFFTSEVHSEAAKVASSMGALVLDRDVLNDNEILEAVSLLIEDHS